MVINKSHVICENSTQWIPFFRKSRKWLLKLYIIHRKTYGLLKHQLLVRHQILTHCFFNMTYVFGFINITYVKCWKKHIGTQKSWWEFSLVMTTAGGKQEKQDNLNTWTECNTKVETTQQALQDDQHNWLFEVPKMAHYSSKWSIYILSRLSVSIPSRNMSRSKEQVGSSNGSRALEGLLLSGGYGESVFVGQELKLVTIGFRANIKHWMQS